MELEKVNGEDIVIVGGGIAGLTTALALHRLGIRSLVLESSASLRASGFAYASWSNAWKPFDALGISRALREQHPRLHRYVATSTVTGTHVQLSLTKEEIEVRCVRRQVLVETLAKELPIGSIRFSSRVAHIEESGYFKLLHLNDGTTIKTKVLIGCDGVNSVVAKWLGFKKPIDTGRESIRGFAHFEHQHGFDLQFMQFYGGGYRCGFVPCDDTTIYWFFTWSSSTTDKKVEDSPMKMKQFVLSKLNKKDCHQMKIVVENTEETNMIHANLKYRNPWELLRGNISKGSTCVAGDALHAMTPDIGQGGCSALEDGVVLARCLSEALRGESDGEEECYKRVEIGLKKYGQQRKWRSFDLVVTAYLVGYVQESRGRLLGVLRDKFLAQFLAGLLLKISNFDCGNLINVS